MTTYTYTNTFSPKNTIVQPGQLLFKTPELFTHLCAKPFSPALIEILHHIIEHHGAVVTETYRPQYHSNDLHGVLPVRAVDIRSWCYPGQGNFYIHTIADQVNGLWQYDPSRTSKKVFIVHGNRNSIGIHAHIQVHPNTTKRSQS